MEDVDLMRIEKGIKMKGSILDLQELKKEEEERLKELKEKRNELETKLNEMKTKLGRGGDLKRDLK